MELPKLSISQSASAFTVAALLAFTSGPLLSQESADPGSLKGLLRPTTRGAQQDPGHGRGSPLQRVDDEGPVTSHVESDPLALEETYRMRLLAPDLDAREEAFDQIALEATRVGAAQAALESIAEDLGDPDLAFTARLVLREARRGSVRSSQFSASPWPQGGGLQPLEALEHRMQEMLENDPFVRNFISTDPFAHDPFFRMGPSGLFRKRPSLFGAGDEDPFDELRQRMGEWRQEIEERGSTGLNGAQVQTRGSSMSIETTPDGVQIEITQDDGTGPTTHTYKGESMETILEAHPELKERIR